MRENDEEETGVELPRVLFLYALPYWSEFVRYADGKIPSHRLWGAAELSRLGWAVVQCPDPKGWWGRLGGFGWRFWQCLWALRESGTAAGLVAVHEAGAVFLLAARRMGVLRSPCLVVNMALLHPRNLCGIRSLVWRWLLGGTDAIASLVNAQNERVAGHFGVSPERLVFLPMGVDADFGGVVDPDSEERFCLAVGTNDGKDFETLLEALPLGERLVIVTDDFNAEKVRRHPCFGAGIELRKAVEAIELRELYRRAAVIVIPLADTSHGSGHTVFLETIALGKLVIVSASRNMEGYAEAGVNALTVPVGDALALRDALVNALNSPRRFLQMRKNAAVEARRRFSMEGFGRRLDGWLRGFNPENRDALKVRECCG